MSLNHDVRRTRYLLACGLAPALFVTVLLVEGATRPGYDPVHHFGSELSLGSGGWVQVANFIVTGLLVLGFAAGMRRAMESGRGSVAAPILTGVFGVTLIVAGIFPIDPKPGYPPGATGTTEAITVSGTIHDLNGLLSFTALTATVLVLAAWFADQPGRRGWMWGCLAIGLVVPVTFVLVGVLFSQAAAAGTLEVSSHGLVQRFTIALGFGWLSVIALLLLREHQQARGSSLPIPAGQNTHSAERRPNRVTAELAHGTSETPTGARRASRRLAVMLTNRSAPPATVTPVLVYPDVRAAVAWLESAFGFEERVRIGEAHRAQMRVGAEGAIVVADVHGDQVAPGAGVVTHVIKVRVPDVDAAFARAREAGARVVDEPTTYEYGERSCMLEDVAAHRWELTQTVRDVDPAEWGGISVAPW